MSKFLFASLLAVGTLLGASQVSAQASTRDQIRMIESEYARVNNGRVITDQQLEYYLDRSANGWTMSRISQDMTAARRTSGNNNAWRPQAGWTAREVICSSVNNRYVECRVPFRGAAVITQQISQAACVEGRSWGNRVGAVWVSRGCRARFGIVRTGNNNVVSGSPRTVVCQSNRGAYRECATGFRGRVQLANPLNNSQACVEGSSWGQREGVVWVNRGCRAQFTSVGRRGPRDDYQGNTGWNRDANYAVTCQSIDNRRSVCAWDNRYGSPYIVQRMSQQNNCIEGRDWGYDNRGQLWVDAGCRARFGYR
jgi:hypothetical protein